jgi:hypothetical protein
MSETLAQAAYQAAGILAGASGYHLTKNYVPKPKVLTPLKCYDSVTLDDLPEGGDAYLAYVNAWPEVAPEKVQARFPKARVVTVATNANYIAEILDVERGAATVAQIVPWYRMARLHGISRPGVYASLSNMPAVKEALKGLSYKTIVADWDGKASIPKGYNGIQYLSNSRYDTSLLGRRAFG